MQHLLIERVGAEGERGMHFTVDRIHLGHCRTALDVLEEMLLPPEDRRHRLYPMKFRETDGVDVNEYKT
jgi:hypothetical protein